MANKYNINGVPPQHKIIQSLDKINLLAQRANIPYTIATESVAIVGESLEQAGTLEDAAQSVNAPIEQFNNIRNAMRMKGVDKNQSIQSTQELYSQLNSLEVVNNGNYSVLSGLLHNYDSNISRNENGTVDVPNTILSIARIFPVMTSQDQNTLVNTVELNKDSVTLLREGEDLGHLLYQAKNIGYNSNPDLHQRKKNLNDATNKFEFLFDSWVDKQKDKISDLATHGNFLSDFIGGFTDSYGFDRKEKTLVEYYAEQNGYDMSWYKTVIDDPEFTQQLDSKEKESLLKRIPLQSLDAKHRKYKQIKDDTVAIDDMVTTGKVPDFIDLDGKFNPVTDLLYLGSETENTWNNNRVRDLTVSDPYSLEPSITISPDGNLVTSSENISPNDNIVSNTANISPIYSESVGGFNAGDIADVIATAMQNNRVQIELTLIDSRTGETSVLLGQGGGRISYAMVMPM